MAHGTGKVEADEDGIMIGQSVKRSTEFQHVPHPWQKPPLAARVDGGSAW